MTVLVEQFKLEDFLENHHVIFSSLRMPPDSKRFEVTTTNKLFLTIAFQLLKLLGRSKNSNYFARRAGIAAI